MAQIHIFESGRRKRTHFAAGVIDEPTALDDWCLPLFKKERGTGILGITFFTALWILYVERCALHAAAETDRSVCNSMLISLPLLGVTKQPETYWSMRFWSRVTRTGPTKKHKQNNKQNYVCISTFAFMLFAVVTQMRVSFWLKHACGLNPFDGCNGDWDFAPPHS